MFQYRLSTLLFAMASVAIGAWVLFVLPNEIGLLVFSLGMSIVPGLVAAGIVYFGGYRQAFCIGSAPVQLIVLLLLLQMFHLGFPFRLPNSPWGADAYTLKMTWLILMGSAIFAGAGGILIRYLAQPEQAAPSPPASVRRTVPLSEDAASTARE